jgi:thiol-disulfide isomerase/thioredoxin
MKILFTLFLVVACLVSRAAEPEYPQQGSDVYDVKADGATLVAAALTRAQAEGKNVLLDFGANWCPWCHKLHGLFTNNATVKAAIERNFVLVYIDVNKRNGPARNAAVNERFGNPVANGLPVLVVTDATGKVLATQDTGELEDGGHHSPKKVLAFLARWTPVARK